MQFPFKIEFNVLRDFFFNLVNCIYHHNNEARGCLHNTLSSGMVSESPLQDSLKESIYKNMESSC